jgi:hypothetical protein
MQDIVGVMREISYERRLRGSRAFMQSIVESAVNRKHALEAGIYACMHVFLFFLRMYICICLFALTFMQSIVESAVNRKHAL